MHRESSSSFRSRAVCARCGWSPQLNDDDGDPQLCGLGSTNVGKLRLGVLGCCRDVVRLLGLESRGLLAAEPLKSAVWDKARSEES
mmetsp:Transcript_8432/g.23802  ORF Transcript_8432/g.23802 Transcript_8432/m.23802 type:complete len:86 (-) Transcript_8432:1932-2189(-)